MCLRFIRIYKYGIDVIRYMRIVATLLHTVEYSYYNGNTKRLKLINVNNWAVGFFYYYFNVSLGKL